MNVTLTGGKRKVRRELVTLHLLAESDVFVDEPQPNIIEKIRWQRGCWRVVSRIALLEDGPDQIWVRCLESGQIPLQDGTPVYGRKARIVLAYFYISRMLLVRAQQWKYDLLIAISIPCSYDVQISAFLNTKVNKSCPSKELVQTLNEINFLRHTSPNSL